MLECMYTAFFSCISKYLSEVMKCKLCKVSCRPVAKRECSLIYNGVCISILHQGEILCLWSTPFSFNLWSTTFPFNLWSDIWYLRQVVKQFIGTNLVLLRCLRVLMLMYRHNARMILRILTLMCRHKAPMILRMQMLMCRPKAPMILKVLLVIYTWKESLTMHILDFPWISIFT